MVDRWCRFSELVLCCRRYLLWLPGVLRRICRLARIYTHRNHARISPGIHSRWPSLRIVGRDSHRQGRDSRGYSLRRWVCWRIAPLDGFYDAVLAVRSTLRHRSAGLCARWPDCKPGACGPVVSEETWAGDGLCLPRARTRGSCRAPDGELFAEGVWL